jgi:glycosyltransferase involved in cell wall biosynthesis
MEKPDTPSLAVIAYNYLDAKGETLYGGGVETWLDEFLQVAASLGRSVVLYQHGAMSWQTIRHGAQVVGVSDWGYPRKAWHRSIIIHRDIVKRGIRTIVYSNPLITQPIFQPGNIFVQHGIYWDGIPLRQNWLGRLFERRAAAQLARRNLKCYLKSRLTIAVDTNFINYARAVQKDRFDAKKIVYLPNFAEPQEQSCWQAKWQEPELIRVAFPRRFEHHRGVALFAKVAERLLAENRTVEFLFLGHGPYDLWLRAQQWARTERVTIREVPHDEMASVLNTVHIAVVPTLHAEGTSLSAIEAMASGCAVIATDVGGLCNLIIPDFNGLLVRPLEEDLYRALNRLLTNVTIAQRLAQNGYSVVLDSFSTNKWRARLAEILDNAC